MPMSSTRAPLRRLETLLIDPVERGGWLEGRHTLVIAPHAELHFLPFGALVTPGKPERFLVERFQLVHAPSASTWQPRFSSRRRSSRSESSSSGLLGFPISAMRLKVVFAESAFLAAPMTPECTMFACSTSAPSCC